MSDGRYPRCFAFMTSSGACGTQGCPYRDGMPIPNSTANPLPTSTVITYPAVLDPRDAELSALRAEVAERTRERDEARQKQLTIKERHAPCDDEIERLKRQRDDAARLYKVASDLQHAEWTTRKAAEAEVARLRSDLAVVIDVLRDSDYDWRARQPSEREVFDRLLLARPDPVTASEGLFGPPLPGEESADDFLGSPEGEAGGGGSQGPPLITLTERELAEAIRSAVSESVAALGFPGLAEVEAFGVTQSVLTRIACRPSGGRGGSPASPPATPS